MALAMCIVRPIHKGHYCHLSLENATWTHQIGKYLKTHNVLVLLRLKEENKINEIVQVKDMKTLFGESYLLKRKRRRRNRGLVFSSDSETVLIRVKSTVHVNCVPTKQNCLHCHLQ